MLRPNMFRLGIRPLFFAPLLISLSSVAHTQEPRVHWHIMGGYSETLGHTADYLQGGYLLGGGFSVTPTSRSPLELRFDLSYSDHNDLRTGIRPRDRAALTLPETQRRELQS
jgi:hypothetical protein